MLENQNQGEPRTARECAKDLIRSYVLDGWSTPKISQGLIVRHSQAYAAQVGTGSTIVDHQGQRHTVTCEQIAVTRVGNVSCWAVFDLLAIIADLRDEQRGYEQQSLVAFFAQEEEQEPPTSVPAPSKRPPVIFRSYIGGFCKHCGEPLGHIEVDGGRDRQYCNDACRVAAFRARKREEKRSETLQKHGELRAYWQEHHIHGEVLLRLQEILFQHGKDAARSATDTVIVALAAQEQAGSQAQARLIDEIMQAGAASSFEEVCFEAFRVPAGLDNWSEFVTNASSTMLRELRYHLYFERHQQEQQRAAARQRLAQLSGDQ